MLAYLLGVHPERWVARALGVGGHASREQVLPDGAPLRQQPSLLVVKREMIITRNSENRKIMVKIELECKNYLRAAGV